MIIYAILSLIVIALNDAFNNSFMIMYNTEVTIAPSFSLLMISKNLGEAVYDLVIRLLWYLVIYNLSIKLISLMLVSYSVVDLGFSIYQSLYVTREVRDSAGLSEKERKTLYCDNSDHQDDSRVIDIHALDQNMNSYDI